MHQCSENTLIIFRFHVMKSYLYEFPFKALYFYKKHFPLLSIFIIHSLESEYSKFNQIKEQGHSKIRKKCQCQETPKFSQNFFKIPIIF